MLGVLAASTTTPFWQLALLAAIASCPGAWAVVRSTRSTRGLRSDLATNDGKRPGEYLEMIAGVRNDVAGVVNGQQMLAARVDNLAAGQGEHAEGLRSLTLAFADHTVEDEVYRAGQAQAQQLHVEVQEQQAADVAAALDAQAQKVKLALDEQEGEVRGALREIRDHLASSPASEPIPSIPPPPPSTS